MSSCTKEELEKLRSENELLKNENNNLKNENKKLINQVTQLKTQVSSLEEENKKFKETDQFYFLKAVEAFKAKKWNEAQERYQGLIERFPNSPLVFEAKKGLVAVKTEIKRIEQERKVACQNLNKKIQGLSPLEAIKLIDDFIASDPESPYIEEFKQKKTELNEQAEREKKEKEVLAKMGIEIFDLHTYWTIETDILGSKQIVIPYIRFKVKNIGNTPIERLKAKASFLLTEKKEVLGEGFKYVIGYGDAPLKPGFSREVFFGSSTGFTGMGILLNRPKVTADLYLDFGDGSTLVKTFNINQKLEGF